MPVPYSRRREYLRSYQRRYMAKKRSEVSNGREKVSNIRGVRHPSVFPNKVQRLDHSYEQRLVDFERKLEAKDARITWQTARIHALESMLGLEAGSDAVESMGAGPGDGPGTGSDDPDGLN
jgi:hypothetical protein